jgi:hypothetical protein
MKSRLYRITPAGAERANHYVDSHDSVLAKFGESFREPIGEMMMNLPVGGWLLAETTGIYIDRVA